MSERITVKHWNNTPSKTVNKSNLSNVAESILLVQHHLINFNFIIHYNNNQLKPHRVSVFFFVFFHLMKLFLGLLGHRSVPLYTVMYSLYFNVINIKALIAINIKTVSIVKETTASGTFSSAKLLWLNET